MTSLAIVGSGPMALYTLKHLRASPAPLDIAVYEASDVVGTGMPYRPGTNADDMLCNAFSREIPFVSRSLIEWLECLPPRELSSWELSFHDLSPRAFYPRVLIGEYLQAEFAAAAEALRAAGHRVSVLPGRAVTDVRPGPDGAEVVLAADGGAGSERFDDVIIATGHVWPRAPEIDGVALVSPWPYTNVTRLPPTDIGVLGSSLSAIDVVVALASAHGSFEEDDRVRWRPGPGAERLRIRMVSHRGIMPEGDFYYPFPYEPLRHVTEEAVLAEVARGQEGLLERVFGLLLRELDEADPAYLRELGPEARTVAGFGDAYFARRQRLGGLRAVRRDLAATRRSMRERETIPHRYALLRGHAPFDRALRHFSEEDLAAFEEHLMPVFADGYAAVPHLSLARVVALHDAGALDLLATGMDSSFQRTEDGGIEAATEDGRVRFDHLVDARGQASHPLSALPFPTLVGRLCDAEAALEEPFRLEIAGADGGRVYCLAMPQLLERYPFSQGLPDCHRLAGLVVDDLLGSAG